MRLVLIAYLAPIPAALVLFLMLIAGYGFPLALTVGSAVMWVPFAIAIWFLWPDDQGLSLRLHRHLHHHRRRHGVADGSGRRAAAAATPRVTMRRRRRIHDTRACSVAAESDMRRHPEGAGCPSKR
jgi:hypothetical protein